MKRILQFAKGDDYKFKAAVNYLIDSLVDFEAHYRADGECTIEFECDENFWGIMLEEVPREYRESYKV